MGLLSMLALQGIVVFGALQFGAIAIAAALWLELRREELRLRRVRKVESILHDEDLCRPREAYFKRVA